jgi:putative two-component system response regulator
VTDLDHLGAAAAGLLPPPHLALADHSPVPPPPPLAEEEFAPATLLIVDSLEVNRLIVKGTLKAGPYRIIECRQPSEAFRVLEREPVDLIIADLMMPECGGLEFCRRVKSNRRTRLVPILMLTSVQGLDSEVAGLESGADEFLIKPLQPAVLRTRVRAMLRGKRAIDSLEEAEAILFTLAQTVEQRDQETGNHCHRLATLSVALGSAIGLPESDLTALFRGGYLHDIGKVAIPDSILFKPGALDDEEWSIMRSHTWRGERICLPMRTLAPVLPIIRSHHERWDGSGYPDGLQGENIPLLARILQLADVYDALTSKRAYKEALAPQRALDILAEEACRGWRDPELASVFREILRCPGVVSHAEATAAAGARGSSDFAALAAMRESLAQLSRELLR